jgi:cell division protein FtsI (penicillin-binding protein 3)
VNRLHTPVSYPWRVAFLLGVLALFIIVLILRVINLSVLDRNFLERQGNARTLRTVEIPAYRGMITDRHGYPLAISTPVYAVSMNPAQFNATPEQLSQLAHLLQMEPSAIEQLKKRAQSRGFVYLKRHVLPDATDKMKAMKIKGLTFAREYRRYYPEGEVTAQLIGFTNIDDHGIEGMELGFDPLLHGEPGKKQVIKDLHGDVVAEVEQLRAPRAGQQLTLSIDRHLQYLAYHELKAAIQKHQARAGSVVILDVKTGEILALVNQPSYNPNKRGAREDLSYRNQAVTDLMEPGSTLKPFSVANALASGQFKPSDRIDTTPGTMPVGTKVVRDLHNEGVLTISGILERSSNIGVTKLSLAMHHPASLWQLLANVGFGKTTASHFPGESAGQLEERKIWAPFTLATLSFGYGLSVTPLQLASAYSVFAAHGVQHPVSLVKVEGPLQSKQVLDAKVANDVLAMLENVVSMGTGRTGRVAGYRIGGKTGTVRVVTARGYDKNAHNGLFVGIGPVSDPRIVVVVVIKEPQTSQYYGGEIAAPVFAAIMAGSLRKLGVAPDAVIDPITPEVT